MIDESANDAWGIAAGYHSIDGEWHPTTDDTRRQLQHALGANPDQAEPPAEPPVWFVPEHSCPTVNNAAVIALEDGTEITVHDHLPPDLPVGYHDLHPADGGPTTRLIVSPIACPDPPWPRAWGIAIQLYAARSSSSWGFGDFADLAALGRQATLTGAATVALNPFHAPLPNARHDPSPYFPSSRRYRNPLYLCVDRVSGSEMASQSVQQAAQVGRSLLTDRRIDREVVWSIKMRAWNDLDSVHDTACTGTDPDFDAYVLREGEALERFCAFNTLAEFTTAHGPPGRPVYAHPDGHHLAEFTSSHRERIRFHMWLQFLLDEQLATASTEIVLIHDLAVGVTLTEPMPGRTRRSSALDLSVGAPPDPFSEDGQDWGIPPFRPWRLRTERYQPLIDVLRSNLRHGGGLRIDHVMGLFRLFCRPRDQNGAAGAYVHFPRAELADIVAIEARRAGAFVVGEDLGTVEPGVRDALAARRMLSYRVAMFESEPIECLPEQSARHTDNPRSCDNCRACGAEVTEPPGRCRADGSGGCRGRSPSARSRSAPRSTPRDRPLSRTCSSEPMQESQRHRVGLFSQHRGPHRRPRESQPPRHDHRMAQLVDRTPGTDRRSPRRDCVTRNTQALSSRRTEGRVVSP